MTNAPQDTIGKYHILATLGSGSQGAVYRAYDETLEREVALKVLHTHLATPDLVERFRREARIIASIPHPNIAGVSEIGESGGYHYIAIEYVPHSLAELVERGALDVTLAASIAYQTALALEAARASENAITHHDVKPDNILLTSLDAGAVVKLIDFGIAHAEGMTSITQTGSQWGTPLYMPPEQWAGERGDTRSDIYSLGVVLYQTLAGRPPFDSDAANGVAKQTEIARQHQQTAAPPLRSVRGDVPEALDAVVAKCMAKSPSARYRTPGELAAALSAIFGFAAPDAPPTASITPVQTRRQPRPPRRAPSRRPRSRAPLFGKLPPSLRNRVPLIAAGFGVLIVAILAFLAVSQSGGSAPDLPPRIVVVAPPTNAASAPPRAASGFARAPRAASAWTSVSVGGWHTCALRANGDAECWGNNGNGQSDPPAGPFAAISAGYGHTCALLANGAATCWGNGIEGARRAAPSALSFASISAGGNHACGLLESGAAACWGDNGDGQSDPPAGSFASISAGGGHTCALRENGAAECWGNNGFGQASPPAGPFAAISAGEWHTCALRENGVAECWGNDGFGQADPPAGSFAAIDAGSSHTCALRYGGAAACWGNNDFGRADPPAGSFAAIDAGSSHTCALRDDGGAECWGDNGEGQSTPPAGSIEAEPTPVRLRRPPP